MRKLVLSTFLALPALLFAECLSSDEAQSIAEAFFSNAQTSVYKSAAEAPQVNLVWDGEEPVYKRAGADDADASTVSDPAFYVFNKEDGKGFVIVSGETATDQPILGYSLDQSFEVNDMPENVYGWMMGYKKEINTARVNGIVTTKVATNDFPEVNPKTPIKLIKTALWDQKDPYNGRIAPHVTGCPATALAIIMRHHEWPDKGVGNMPSLDQFEELDSTHLGHAYLWNKMPLKYTKAATAQQKDQVAVLMRDLGILLRTSYSGDRIASAWPMEILPILLPSHMKYDASTIRAVQKFKYDDSSWNRLMQEELNANRPILYQGLSKKEGHAFVLDGYAEDNYFHINWGWSGLSNGYFLLTTLNPSNQGAGGTTSKEGFVHQQKALIGIQPDKNNPGGTPYDLVEYANYRLWNSGFCIVGDVEKFETGHQYQVNLQTIKNSGTSDFTGKVAIAHFNVNDEIKGFMSDTIDFKDSPLPVGENILKQNINFTIQLPIEVNDRARAVYQVDGSSDWRIIRSGSYGIKEECILKKEVSPTAVEEIDGTSILVFGVDGTIHVEDLTELSTIEVYNISGQLLASTTSDDAASFDLPTSQVYIVRVGEKSVKVRL